VKKNQDDTDIGESTRRYEAWLRRQTTVVDADLQRKHVAMGRSVFEFLRATYYRWAETWPQECRGLAEAPRVLAVGDLHVENFGTWRDAEGRLAWGINDFDEAAPLPYTSDLVRLATSACLASRESRLRLKPRDVCATLLAGYAEALRAKGAPIILAERHRRLGERVLDVLVEPRSFWTRKISATLRPRPAAPKRCRDVLRRILPDGSAGLTIQARAAGVGSLGRLRFVALARWDGARIAREAKAFVSSASLWARGEAVPDPPHTFAARLLKAAIRSHDPFLSIADGWIVRRLAPDSDKIRLGSLGNGFEPELLTLMGRETANVHVATPGAATAILRHLGRLKPGWLRKAARKMSARTRVDHRAWRLTPR
jgi:hypothetical protein